MKPKKHIIMIKKIKKNRDPTCLIVSSDYSKPNYLVLGLTMMHHYASTLVVKGFSYFDKCSVTWKDKHWQQVFTCILTIVNQICRQGGL